MSKDESVTSDSGSNTRGPFATVLVTGGAGFIGSTVVRQLCDSGYRVRVIDDLSTGHRHAVDQRCEFVKASLVDTETLRTALRGVDAVIHMAASSIIRYSIERPIEYVENNLLNGARLLEAMRAEGVSHIVFSSSAAVYGEPVRIPIKEDDHKAPLQPYGATKLGFEVLLQSYANGFGMHSVSLRYFNAYGPGDLQLPVTRAVPNWIQSALTGRPIVIYWGGQQLRDYVYVDDIAEAHIRVLHLQGCRAYNLGSGSGISMQDMVQTITRLLDRPVRVTDGGPRPGDPMSLVADISRIQAEIGWSPKTSLERGLTETIKYYRENMRLWQHTTQGE